MHVGPSTIGAAASSSTARAPAPASEPRGHAAASSSSALPNIGSSAASAEPRPKRPSLLPPTANAVARAREQLQGRALSFHDFDLRHTVGIGSFGRVRMCKLKGVTDAAPMALKILKKFEVVRLKQVEHIKIEKNILTSIDHPFVVNLLCTFQDEKRLFMLLEYVNGGELYSFLRKQGRLPSDTSRFYAAEIVLVFAYLHGMFIAYRDLKPENVLLDCDGHVKLTDFGFAKVVEDRTWTLCGTPEYLAPEIIQSKGHGRPVDWWALGILIFEMLAGYPPFFDESPFGIYQKVLQGAVSFPRHFDLHVKDLCKQLLNHDKTKRIGCLKAGVEDVKRHKWFKNIAWDRLLSRTVRPPMVPNVKSVDDTSMFDRYPESTEGHAPPITDQDQRMFDGFESVPL